MDAPTLHRDSISGRHWLVFDGKPNANTIQALKSNGWRFSGYRQAWHTNKRFPTVPFEHTKGEDVEWSAERAERLEARADKAEVRANAMLSKARSTASMIPFGEPIKVGHHSEGRHRRDIQRINNAFGKGFEEHTKAERLDAAAERSRKHQENKDTYPVRFRRVERLRKDLKVFEARSDPRAAQVREELAREEALLPPAPVLDVKKGDKVRTTGWGIVEVVGTGSRNLTILILSGGAKGMRLKLGREDVLEVVP